MTNDQLIIGHWSLVIGHSLYASFKCGSRYFTVLAMLASC
jgi:hypothetical protein